MTQATNDLLTQALRLPENERGEFAARLIESLDPISDSDAESAWNAEIRRRIEELRHGEVKPLSWPEARRQIMEDQDESS